jgi:amidohydrolase
MARPTGVVLHDLFGFRPGPKLPFLIVTSILLFGLHPALSAGPPGLDGLDALYPSLDALYIDLHQNPELSLHEEKTAAKLAARLRALGFEVTERVGGHGIVGVLRNGAGPTVLVRTDMDALPIKEQTGLAYASAVTVKTDAGGTVPVMHACGHDIHMVSWIGAASLLAGARNRWHGTLLFVGQPAEETLQGAEMMVKDGLLTRFAKPDFVLGIHDTNLLPAGQIGVVAGPASAASNAVDITFFGKGGHGAQPHLAIDPVVMAARTVVTLQTIVSREVRPFDPAVVTVGTFHAGTKRNIIADQAKIELTVRSYKPEVQKQLLAAIERIAKAEAAAAGAPREPAVFVDPNEASEVVFNDPALVTRLTTALRRGLREDDVVSIEPTTSSEDFGVFGRVAGVPSIQLRVGAVEPGEFAKAKQTGKLAPGPHSPLFAPDRERTIRAGVGAFTLSVLDLLGRPGKPSKR